jgi:hypothetical protein
MPPAPPNLTPLFKTLEGKFSAAGLDPSRWPILAIATLTAFTEPDQSHQLYTYLTSKPEYASPESRQALVRRLRETLVKSISIVGVCKPIESILSIASVEREEDLDYTSTCEGWQ